MTDGWSVAEGDPWSVTFRPMEDTRVVRLHVGNFTIVLPALEAHKLGSALHAASGIDTADMGGELALLDGACFFCRPKAGVTFDPRDQHVACGLRAVVGGIGHLTDHAYWCGERGDPDAGLTYRESALRVAEWVQTHGTEAAVAVGDEAEPG